MKTSVSLRAPRLVALLALAFASLSVSSLSAQTTVKTVPVGVVNLTIGAAPNASTPRFNPLSLPLTDGIVYTGKLSAVTSNTVTVSTAVSQTITASNPYYIRITSGAHAGRTFVIQSNAGSTLTVDNEGTALNALSPALSVGGSGDSFIIAVADTLNGVFGSRGQGGATEATADQVWIWSSQGGFFAKYFYNTAANEWQDTDFGDPANNTVIKPDAGFFYVRRAVTPLTLSLTGQVPTSNVRSQVKISGFTFVSGAFPLDTTIDGLSLQTSASWVSTASAATSDQIWVWSASGGFFNKFYYDSASGWIDTDFGDPAGTTAITAGTPVFVRKAAPSGSSTVTTVFSLPANYAANNL